VLILLTAPAFANKLTSQPLFKGVVIDSEDGIAYIINPNGGIDSLSISTGLINWHTDSADYPLLIKSSQLIAFVDNAEYGKISLVAIDTHSGVITEKKSIEIPKDIQATVSHGLHQQFDINVNPNDTSSGKIQWQHKQQFVQGMLAEPDNRPVAKLKYGEISLNDSQSLSTAKSKILSQKPHQKIAAIEGKFIDGIEGRQFQSLNQEHILLSQIKSNATVWNKYLWQIFDLDGNQLGQLDNNVSYNTFIVIDDTLLYMSNPSIQFKKSQTINSPLSLYAYSLTSGNHLWNHEIRDLEFKGQVPH
jgi:hypothetical protein